MCFNLQIKKIEKQSFNKYNPIYIFNLKQMENYPFKKQKTEIYNTSNASNTSNTFNLSNSSGNSASLTVMNDKNNMINALENCAYLEFVDQLDIKYLSPEDEECLKFKADLDRLREAQKQQFENNPIYQYFSSVINGMESININEEFIKLLKMKFPIIPEEHIDEIPEIVKRFDSYDDVSPKISLCDLGQLIKSYEAIIDYWNTNFSN